MLETVNLALADMPELFECPESVERQDLDIGLANEVLLVNAGDVPVDVAGRIEARFPWLELLEIDRDSSYERAKQAGFEATTGEVVVFFDSDCRYDVAWLSGLVDALRDHGEYGVMGGSTMIRPEGAYGMAVAATFSFDFSSGLDGLHADTNFHWNNVAFRRSVLQGHPIPDDLPLHRTPPKYYADLLLTAGLRIGRQPVSRALHAAPRRSTFISRYLIFGHDAVVQKRLRSALDTGGVERRPIHGAVGLVGSRIRQTIGVWTTFFVNGPGAGCNCQQRLLSSLPATD
ncbi:MAG: glycosyltransferase [Gammaproteobacteria bacterium]|nr:glycosyltransferase [Gammaproteobacteria bacterium]